MDCAAIAVIASLALGQVPPDGWRVGDDVYLSTPRPYPANMTDSVRRPGFNGRLYLRRPIIGGTAGPYATPQPCPGAEAFGGYGSENDIAWARVNHQPIALDPFRRLPDQMQHQNMARQVWLRQYGFVGGVRTHVNDAYLLEAETVAEAPKPRATIKVPADWRRTPTLNVRGHDPRPVISMSELASKGQAPDRRPTVRLETVEETVADAND